MLWRHHIHIMMTSRYGHIFRVTGLCEGNQPVTDGFPSQRTGNAKLWCLFMYAWTNGGVGGDLKRHDAHVKLFWYLKRTAVRYSSGRLSQNVLRLQRLQVPPRQSRSAGTSCPPAPGHQQAHPGRQGRYHTSESGHQVGSAPSLVPHDCCILHRNIIEGVPLLKPSDAYMRHYTTPALVKIMACAWLTPNHCLKPYRHIIGWSLSNNFQWHLKRNANKWIWEYRLQNYVIFVLAWMRKNNLLCDSSAPVATMSAKAWYGITWEIFYINQRNQGVRLVGHSLTLITAWLSLSSYIRYKSMIKWLIHSQTPADATLKFGSD